MLWPWHNIREMTDGIEEEIKRRDEEIKKLKSRIEGEKDYERHLEKMLREEQQSKYILIPNELGKPYHERWQDKSYLADVRNLATNKAHMSELINIIGKIKEAATDAKTPEELKGINKALKIVNAAFGLPGRAKAILEQMKAMAEQESGHESG